MDQHVTQQGPRSTGPRAESGCGREGEVAFRAEVNLFPTSDGSFESAGIQCVHIDHRGHKRRMSRKTVPAPVTHGTRFNANVSRGPPCLWACGFVGL